MITVGAIFFMPVQGIAQEDDNKIVIGERVTMQSKILDEERALLVYLPDGYEGSQDKYPVIYLLDGRGHFHHATGIVQYLSRQGVMPQAIVIALVNTDRNRDFVPVSIERFPTTGGADNFLTFFNNELKPFVEQKYRTLPYNILIGHSFGGTFATHTLLTRPETFNAYIAISPALESDGHSLIEDPTSALAKRSGFGNFLYVTVGNEPRFVEGVEKFVKILEAEKPKNLDWKYDYMEKDNHGTTPHLSIYNGLSTLYDGWQVPTDVAEGGIETIEAHYKKLSAKFGYEVIAPEATMNIFGYRLMWAEKVGMAIAVLLKNVENYPNSANVYDSLGEIYEADGQLELARKNYEIACKKGETLADPNLAFFKEHLDKVLKKQAAGD